MDVNAFPWPVLVAAFLLAAYVFFRSRSKRVQVLPPLGLLLLYLLLRLANVFLLQQPWGTAWVTHVSTAQDVVLAWTVARLVFWILLELPEIWSKSTPRIPKITKDFILFLSFAALLFIVLRIRSDVNLASLLTTSAVLTVVIGLAAQATLSNFFSGLILQAERPFDIGDWVQIGEHEGRVVGISWKSTQILTRLQVLVIIPNSEMGARIFCNYSKPTRKKIARVFIGVEYGAPPNDVRRVITNVLRQHPKILRQPSPVIRLVEFGDFAITYEVRFWHNNYTHEPQIVADVNNQLWYALKRNRIRIPFPIRDVYHAHIERRHHKQMETDTRRDIETLLNQVPVLKPLSDKERNHLAAEVDIEVYGGSETVFEQGDSGDSMYIIASGECEVVKKDAAESPTVIGTLGRGEFFGEMGLLTGAQRSAGIRVNRDTTLIKIDKQKFSTILSANPAISEHIGQIMAQRLADNTVRLGRAEAVAPSSRQIINRIKVFFGL